MPSFRSLILLHGYAFLFCYILAVQSGVPVPSDPVLLIMGAAVGDHRYHFVTALLIIVAAAMLGDSLWYELGRARGRSVLKLLCRFAIEPDTCVRKTELGFMRRGAWSMLFVKFVPGMGLVSNALAGAMKMPRAHFLLADAAGATIWAAAYLGAGALFRRQVDLLLIKLGLYGRRAGLVILLLLAAFLCWRYFQRMRFRRELRINRVEPAEVNALLNGSPPPLIVDLRSPDEVKRTGQKIFSARVLRPSELRRHFEEFPHAGEVVLYCT